MGKRQARSAEEAHADENIDEQIRRLREILVLMAPESGSSALGAMRAAAPDVPLRERVTALNAFRR
jgi:hypothetical protein